MSAHTRRRSPNAAALRLGLGVALVVALLGAPAAEAQQTTGSLLGTVSDAGGGAIAGATVTATQRDTGFVRAGKTDSAGAFRFPNVPLGRYDIR
ncbi:MAG: hypothetical protein DMF78_24795, partial [Acidobacteria bacterium]